MKAWIFWKIYSQMFLIIPQELHYQIQVCFQILVLEVQKVYHQQILYLIFHQRYIIIVSNSSIDCLESESVGLWICWVFENNNLQKTDQYKIHDFYFFKTFKTSQLENKQLLITALNAAICNNRSDGSTRDRKSDIFTDLSIQIFPSKIGSVGGHEHNIILMSVYSTHN